MNKYEKNLSKRARPLEVKTVQIPIHHPKMKTFKPKVSADLAGDKLTLTAGLCPCATCGHKYMEECEEADCQCCSCTCT